MCSCSCHLVLVPVPSCANACVLVCSVLSVRWLAASVAGRVGGWPRRWLAASVAGRFGGWPLRLRWLVACVLVLCLCTCRRLLVPLVRALVPVSRHWPKRRSHLRPLLWLKRPLSRPLTAEFLTGIGGLPAAGQRARGGGAVLFFCSIKGACFFCSIKGPVHEGTCGASTLQNHTVFRGSCSPRLH